MPRLGTSLVKILAFLIIFGASVRVAWAQPSFDCSRANKPDELAICSDSRLSELDRIAASGFNLAQRLPGNHDLVAGVQSLLAARMSCGANKNCILEKQVEVLRLYQQSGLPVTIPSWVSQSGSIAESHGRAAKCLLEVNKVHYLGGICSFTVIDDRGSFRIKDLQDLGLVVQVISTDKDEGAASWNGPIGGNIPAQDLGKVYRVQACWQNDSATICAWNPEEQVSLESTPPDPKPNTAIKFGIRDGMYEDIVSEEDLNTSHAVIKTAPSRKAAIVYCRSRNDYTVKCIEDQISSSKPAIVKANCPTGQFSDFWGDQYKYVGKNPDTTGRISANYLIQSDDGGFLDGTSASSYEFVSVTFQSLCPAFSPVDWFK